jgi:hypothetical protein
LWLICLFRHPFGETEENYENFVIWQSSIGASVWSIDKSAVADHSINLGHRIQLQDTSILYTMGRMIREAVEIKLPL